tara:strand:- start:46 stop:450 length:405 start_codon:yes stop_codon:yes gene_type:complete
MSKDSKNKMFDGTNFEDLAKDIYENQKLKKTQIDLLIQELHSFIQTAEDALMIAPIIKEYFDVSVKNDEHLVKLASVVQRYVSKSKESNSDDNAFGLSDKEKDELMNTLQTTVNDLQKESDRIDNLKNKNFKGN